MADTDEQQNTDEQDDAAADNERQDDGSYPTHVVKGLREKNGRYRTRVHEAEERATAAETRADELNREVFRMRVEANGKLADPEDLDYDADLLTTEGALDEAIDELIKKRPHYAKKKINGGGAGQGAKSDQEEPRSLMGILSHSV